MLQREMPIGIMDTSHRSLDARLGLLLGFVNQTWTGMRTEERCSLSPLRDSSGLSPDSPVCL